MADAQANINIGVDASLGIQEIKQLQRQIAQLNAQLLKSGAEQIRSAERIQRNLINNINATGQFAASVRNISTTTESFTNALERNKLSMGQYFKYAAASTKTFGRLFGNEFNTIEKVARERVKTIQTQFVKLGRDGSGAMKAIAIRPLVLDMNDLGTKTAIAAQKQQLLNQLLKQGSTNLLNFGKNTQWAGRQLMVGFTIPLAYLGTAASKTFMTMEKQAIRFKRVYGDTFTATAETDKMLKQVKALASEFTKYGVAVEKTMSMAADAAAMGKMGADLLAQINEATRLAVLGGVEQEQALETTISLTNAFGIEAEKLAGKINFLNAVENQTVTSIEDLTIAVPKAGPVIQQLGGDVEDLAFFLTAMKEGGINASEGANALKSGLASLINPTGKAVEMLNGFGININKIVEANKGDVKGIVVDFAQALDQLDPLTRARSIEQLFGKFQFARLSTLFQNVIKEGTQAERVLQLSAQTSEELAILSERELKRIEESPMYKFQKAVEDLKVSLVPLGEAFIKAITPLVEFAKGFLDNFNNMSDSAKQFAVVATTAVAGIGPILLMTFGLIANGVANLIKMFTAISKIFRGTGAASTDLGSQTEYMTQQQLEASAVAASLDQTHAKLIQTFTAEASAVNNLARAYVRAQIAQTGLLGLDPRTGKPLGGGAAPKKYAKGVVSVPGPKGAGDIVPAMLSPGEAIIPARQSQKYAGLIQGMINDDIPGYRFGLNPFAMMLRSSRVATRMKSQDLQTMLKSKDFRYKSAFETGTGDDYINRISGLTKPEQKLRRFQMEKDVMGLPSSTNPKARPTYGSVELSPFGQILSRLFGLKGKQFRSITSPGNKNLDIYGDVDLVGKRGLNKRSTVFAGDLLKQYGYSRSSYLYRRAQGTISGNVLPPMLGASRKQLEENARFYQFNSPFGKGIPTGPKSFTANPGSPYVEAHVAGGFNLREVSKIRVPSRAEAKQLQKLVDQAGLKIKVTPRNAPAVIKALSNIFGTRFNGGTGGAEKLSFMSFPKNLSLEMSHMARAAGGENRLSKKQLRRRIQRLIRKNSALLKRMGIDPKTITTSLNSLLASPNPAGFYKQYSGMVEPWLTAGNQGTSNITATRLGSAYLKDLRYMPRGLFGSGLLSRLPSNHGIPDNELKSYIATIEKSFKSQLKANYGVPLTEPDLHRFYGQAQKKALSAISNPAARALINDVNALARLGLTVGIPGMTDPETGIRPGRSNVNLAKRGDPQKRLQAAIRGKRFKDFWGEAWVSNYNSKIAPQTGMKVPASVKPQIQEALFSDKLSRRQKLDMVKQLIGTKKSQSMGTAILELLANAGRRRFGAAKPLAVSTKNTSQTASMVDDINPRDFIWSKYNNGVVSVPGKGNRDTVPAMLTPGEAVIPADMAKKYGPLINSMISDSIPGYVKGRKSRFNFGTPVSQGGRGKTGVISRQEADAFAKQLERAARRGSLRRAFSSLATTFTGVVSQGMVDIRTRQLMFQERYAQEKAITQRQEEKRALQRIEKEDAKRVRRADKAALKAEGIPTKQSQSIISAPLSSRLSPEEKANRKLARAEMKERVMGKAGGVGMAAGMAAMMYGMSGGPGSEIASMAAFPLMMLPQLLPLIMNPIGAAVAGLVALGAGLVILNNNLNDLRKTTYKTADGLTVSEEKMMSLAEFAGTVTPGEYLAKRRQSQFAPIEVASGKTTFGQAFMKSEAGAGMLESFNATATEFGKEKAIAGLQKQLGLAIVTKILSKEQAQSIAASLGQALGDYGITASINASIAKIVGPDGKPLDGNTITIYTRFIQESGAAITGAGGVFDDPLLKTQNIFKPGETAELEAAAAATTKGFFTENQAIIDAFDAERLKEIDALKAEGRYDEALAKEKKYQEDRKALVQAYLKEIGILERKWIETSPASQSAILNLLKDDIIAMSPAVASSIEKFKNAYSETYTYDAEGNVVDRAQSLESVELDNKKLIIMGQLAAGDIDETTFNGLMSMFDPNTKEGAMTWNVLTDISTEFGPDALRQFNLVADILDNPAQATQLAVNLQYYGAEEGGPILDTLTEIAQLGEGEGIQASVILDTILRGGNLDEITAKFEKLNDLKSKDGLNIKMLVESEVITDGDAKLIEEEAKRLGIDLSKPGELVRFTKVFLSKTEAVSADELKVWKDKNPDIAKYLTDDEIAKRIAIGAAAQYVQTNPSTDTTKGGDDDEEDDPTGPTTKKQDPFEAVLNKLKRFRNARIDASKGIKELERVMANGGKVINKFAGIEQQLLFKGFSQEFIDSVMSMDKESQKKFFNIKNGIVNVTNAAKLMNQAMARANIAEASAGMVTQIAAINKQMSAMTKLTKAGMSVSDAFELIQDEQLAYAIATAKTSADVKKLIKDFEELKKKQLELRASTPEGRLGILNEAIGKVNRFYAARKQQVERDFEFGTNDSGRNATGISIKSITDTISKAQSEIADYQYSIDDLQYQLSGIEEQEEAINKKYDEREEALNKIWSANSALMNQQKAQMSIADALSRGDIAAAAIAMQNAEEERINRAKEDQQRLLDEARERELGAIVATNGKTRVQLEKEILDIQKKIAEIEELRLEPAEKSLRYAEQLRDVALEAVAGENYLGKNQKAWEDVALKAELAVVQAEAYKKAILDALALLPGLSSMFDANGNFTGFNFDSKKFAGEQKQTSVYQAEGVTVLDKNKASKAANAAVNKGGFTTSRGVTITATDPLDFANQVRSFVLANREAATPEALARVGAGAAWAASEAKRLAAENVALMQATGLKFAMGGMVPKRYAAGGFAMGTDTIPAMLSPGEFVVRKYAVQSFGTDNLKAINNGTYKGDSVYNYEVNVNVKSDANPDEIAKAVMTQIRQVDSQRLRRTTF